MIDYKRIGFLSLAVLSLLAVAGAQIKRQRFPDTLTERTEQLSAPRTDILDNASVQFGQDGRLRRVMGSISMEQTDSFQSIASAFVGRYHTALGITTSDLKVSRDTFSMSADHVFYQQTYQGQPVFRGEMSVNMDRNGKVVWVANDTKAITNPVDLNYRLTNNEAIFNAERSTVGQVDPRYDIPSTQGVFVVSGTPAPAYRLSIHTIGPVANWEVMVNAATGAILGERNVLEYNNSALIFDPDPMSTTGDATITYDNTQPPVLEIQKARKPVTMFNLNSSGFLTGTFADTSPTTAFTRAFSLTHDYKFDYTDPRFEETMAYYHTDAIARYLHSIGFTTVENRQVPIFVDGTTDDNSFYDPGTQSLTFGSGGVPDAQDAGVVWHENGHAIQNDQLPGFGGSEEEGAMGEGWGDYWAFTNTTYKSPHSPAWDVLIAKWDATAYSSDVPPFLRSVATTNHYPEDLDGEVHDDGQIWSSSLHEIFGLMGRDKANTLFLDAHYNLTTTSSMADGANAILATNTTLNAGQNQTAIKGVFASHGILPNDMFTFTEAVSQIPGGHNVTGIITLIGRAGPSGQDVKLTSSNTAAVTVPATVKVPAGQKSVTFQMVANSLDANASSNISARVGTGTTKSVSLFVAKAQIAQILLSKSELMGGSNLSYTVVLSGPAGPSGLTVYTTSSGPGSNISGFVVVPHGQVSVVTTVPTNGVDAQETDTVTARTGAVNATSTVTIDAASLIVFSPRSNPIGGTPEPVTITLNGAAGPSGAAIAITTDSTLVPNATLTVPYNQSSMNNRGFPTQYTPSSVLVKVTGTYKGTSLSFTMDLQTVLLAGINSVGSMPQNSSADSLVTLDGKAPAGGAVVSLTSSNPAVLSVPATVTVPGDGSVQTSYHYTTGPVTTNTSVTITATYRGLTKTTTTTVHP